MSLLKLFDKADEGGDADIVPAQKFGAPIAGHAHEDLDGVHVDVGQRRRLGKDTCQFSLRAFVSGFGASDKGAVALACLVTSSLSVSSWAGREKGPIGPLGCEHGVVHATMFSPEARLRDRC